MEYFLEVAFGAEYGPQAPVLHRWERDLRIKVSGAPTSADMDTLGQVVAELNNLVSGISLSIVTDRPNVEVHLIPVSRFPAMEPNYVPGNWGFFWVRWDASGAIVAGRILIASDRGTQRERSHLIREEVTQIIGLMKDSTRYKESVFYEAWTETTSYAPIDRSLIRLLYEPRLKPGMTRDQMKAVIR